MTQPHARLYALDGLRAVMMLLGVVLHSIISYATFEAGAGWPYDDAATTIFADWTVILIHVFRMPIFFLMAGFFAALLCLRRGSVGLARNRFTRVVVPFVVSWIVLYPLVMTGFAFANSRASGSFQQSYSELLQVMGARALFAGDTTMHLWFLYYLIYFYGVALLMVLLTRRLPGAIREGVLRGFEMLARRPLLRVLVMAALTAATLVPMDGTLRTSTSFLPDPVVLLAYAVFFGFGWLFYLKRELLASCERGAWTQTLMGTGLFFATHSIVQSLGRDPDMEVQAVLLGSAVGGLVVWLLTFGLTGLFLRYLDRPSPVVRYIVDSSYWVYLIHLPCTIWIPGLLSQQDLSAWAKMSIVLAATAVIGFVSYDLLVRGTVIGKVLNGRRYPRGLPAGVPPHPAPANLDVG